MTGIDLSQLYIDIATQQCDAEGRIAEFFHGDTQGPSSALGDRRCYVVIINVFTSNGYFGKTGDITTFGRFRGIAEDDATLSCRHLIETGFSETSSRRGWTTHETYESSRTVPSSSRHPRYQTTGNSRKALARIFNPE